MRVLLPSVLPLLFVACAPAEAVLGTGSLADAQSADSADPAGGGDGEPGDTGDAAGGGDEGPAPAIALRSGDWVAAGAGTEDDPCGWNDLIADNAGIDVLSLLPTDFVVEAEEGRFEIEAQDYGAAGFIECEIDSADRFTCEAQSVSPEAYDLGFYGWTYRIDFRGTVVDEDTLQGEAIVAFPTVDRGTEDVLRSVGIDVADCTQAYSLVLELGG